MGMKELWRNFTRSVKQNKWGLGFLFAYALFLGIIGRYGLDLDLERDRSWFQGFVAFGIALFIFFQFNLDYLNRRRNILYEKQIDALIEYHSIVDDLLTVMAIGPKESLSSIDSIKMLVQRHDEFTNCGRDYFLRNIAIRSPKITQEALEQRIQRLTSLFVFFKKTSFNPTEVFDIRRKITTWKVISLEKMKDLSEFSERFEFTEVSIGELLMEMFGFVLAMKVIIKNELDVL